MTDPISEEFMEEQKEQAEMAEERNWNKEKPFDGEVHDGCLNCPPTHKVAPMEMIIAVGFGDARITKDEETIFSEESDEDFRSLEVFEEMAKQDPNHDWRAILNGPLRGRTYQRHGVAEWVLIYSNRGFA